MLPLKVTASLCKDSDVHMHEDFCVEDSEWMGRQLSQEMDDGIQKKSCGVLHGGPTSTQTVTVRASCLYSCMRLETKHIYSP